MTNKGGRPSIHTDELEQRVLSGLSVMSMVKVCELDGMPNRDTIYSWMIKVPGFTDRYARACDERADHRAEMIDDIAERVLSGEVDPQAARVAIDAHKWTASKLRPKKYGERISQELTGADGGAIKTDNKWVIEVIASPRPSE